MERVNRYRVVKVTRVCRDSFYPYVRLWWWPFWITLNKYGYFHLSSAIEECKIHMKKNVVWEGTSDDKE